ncbi:MAG: chemotaxis protein CheX [Glaciecola sp.]|nr:chemotaxis protein CheX [Glaciecola sp.]
MKVEFVNPFINGLLNTLSMMAQTELRAGKPKLKDDAVARGDVSGVIGMVGSQVQGSLSITFEENLALHVMEKMLGEKVTELNHEVADMVGEITNMICGSAKGELSEKGYEFNMATPAVVTGKNHTINHQVDVPRVILPFDSDFGRAFIEICFNK